MFILNCDQFKPESHLKLIKKYVFSKGGQFPLTSMVLSLSIIKFIIYNISNAHHSHQS